MELNTGILLSCILILLFENFRVINRLKKSDHRESVKLSSIWKIGVFIFIIGFITVLFTFSNIYDLITDKTEANQITLLIKENLVSGVKFLAIFFLSIVNWILLKRFRFNI